MFATSVVSVEHGMTVSAIIDPGNRSRAAAVPLTPHARYKIKRDATTSLHRLTALQWQPGALVDLADDARRNEAAPRSIKMVIAVGLAVPVKPMWDDQRQLIFGGVIAT
jgi:hypothetical protein